MQLRYSFRLYPNGPQRSGLARAFGCARVVYNDALRAREDARANGDVFPKTGDLSRLLITEAKKTTERAWLGNVSAVVLQQSLRDLDTAYRNFFDGLGASVPAWAHPGSRAVRTTGRPSGSPPTPGGRSRPAVTCPSRRSAT